MGTGWARAPSQSAGMAISAAVSNWRRSGFDFGLDVVSDGRVGMVVLCDWASVLSELGGRVEVPT